MGFNGKIITNARRPKLSENCKKNKDFKDAAHAAVNAVHMDVKILVQGVETVAAVLVESAASRIYAVKFFSIAKIQALVAVYGI